MEPYEKLGQSRGPDVQHGDVTDQVQDTDSPLSHLRAANIAVK